LNRNGWNANKDGPAWSLNGPPVPESIRSEVPTFAATRLLSLNTGAGTQLALAGLGSLLAFWTEVLQWVVDSRG
jgi:hypothetical protein